MADYGIDRRAFIAGLGGAGAVAGMAPSALADAVEDRLIEDAQQQKTACAEDALRRGAGAIFDKYGSGKLAPMPKEPTLLDFYRLRFDDGVVQHCLRSAHHALSSGQDEIHVVAALLHDTVMSLVRTDHGYWGADLVAPYVDERVAWGIRYHQAARFYPDESVGYEYPELYKRLFGEDFEPEPYIQAAYAKARKHKWYMHARMITVNDTYGFDDEVNPTLDEFVDVIGRHFRQPSGGLGRDDSPSAHMWRTLINPDRPL